MTNEIFSPVVPLNIPIVNGLPEGARVLIEGAAFNGSQRSFAVELYAGPNIALHVNFRFGHFNEYVIVLNSKQEGQWKHEERQRIPFNVGQSFKIKIKNNDNKYKIKVNGEEFHFHHRIPPNYITGFGIVGDVTVQRIHFKNFHEQCFQPGNYGPILGAHPQPNPGYNLPLLGFGAAPSAPAYQPYGAPPPPQPYGGGPPIGYGAYGPPHVIRIQEVHHYYYHRSKPKQRRGRNRWQLLNPLGDFMDKADHFISKQCKN